MKTLQFKNGDAMPVLGLGTWKSAPGEVHDAVLEALKAGYRHIDCAAIYGNEKEIGKAFSKAFDEGLVKREELWVTSKLWNSSHLRHEVAPALRKTLSDLQLEYLDLYLIHWPVALKEGVALPEGPEDFLTPEEAPILETWKGMEEMVEQGLARHIGVSNFTSQKIKHLMQEGRMPPEVNQIEMHPYLQQKEMVEFCHANNVHLTAYSPLGSRDRTSAMKKEDEPNLFEDAVINEIADKHGCSGPQVLLAWHINRGCSVIPKSVNPTRIRENLEAASIPLDAEDMEQIAGLDRHYRFVDGSFWAMENSPWTLEMLWEE